LDAGGDQRYAPVSSASLARTNMGISAWFLGHIHGPTIQSGGRPIGYLGSLVGLDAGELGAHGPWLAESAPGQWNLEHIPMSPIRWEQVAVDVQECVDLESLSSTMGRALKDLEARLSKDMDGTRVVGVRMNLEGVCPVPLVHIRRAMVQALELDLNLDGVYYFVDKVRDFPRLPLDLEAVSRQSDPAGLMATRLLDLEAGAEACAALIANARPRMEAVDRHGNFSHLNPACADDEEIREILVRVARRALEELLSQKSAAPALQLEEEQHA
jgi:exonuclease SbcD